MRSSSASNSASNIIDVNVEVGYDFTYNSYTSSYDYDLILNLFDVRHGETTYNDIIISEYSINFNELASYCLKFQINFDRILLNISIRKELYD